MSQPNAFLPGAIALFQYYKSLADKALSQIEAQRWYESPHEDSNSIAVILRHMSGNMLSRWTDFLETDGEKEWRDRDGEFQPATSSQEELLEDWELGWKCLFDALGTLTEEDLSRTVYIRNEGHSVLDAIQRQLAHYPYHVGQIVFAAKLLKKTSWTSLSIPRNQSGDYNRERFATEKGIRHFTESERDKLR